MDHPAAVIEKAKRLEQLLQRVEQGEPVEQVSAELDLPVNAERLAQLQVKYEAGGRTWEALIDGRYGHPQKAHSALREWLSQRKRQDKELTASQLVDEVKTQFKVERSAGHINYLLRKVELTRPPGRPPNQPAAEADSTEPEALSQSLDDAGIFFPRSSEGRDGPPRGGRKQSGDGPPGVSGGKPQDFAEGSGQ